MSKAPLRIIRRSKLFKIYQTLLRKGEVGNAEAETLLAAAVVFLNHENPDILALGYRIIVMYSNLTGDYRPLYDVAIGRGYMPIVATTHKNLVENGNSENFFTEYFSSLLDLYEKDGSILTEQQLDLNSFFDENKTSDLSVTAPTSYGKSELISGFCNKNLQSNICILVPTKALLAQTKQRLLQKNQRTKVGLF
ncbi:hypothetical protein QT397_00035 (plasmid) [Microbulbifer sp. MKSA007]|nr:hypothetical protein QT397_00035 [Microbulbifer sp. MKSA007]